MSQLAEILSRGDFNPRPFKNTKPIVDVFGASDGVNPVEPYVVPAGRKALWASYSWNNPTGSAGNIKNGVKRADATRRWIQLNAMTAGQISAATQPVVLAAGERPTFDVGAIAGVVCGARSIMEFDDDGTVFRIDADLAAGDNVLYTVPAGKYAVVFTASMGIAVTSSPFFNVGNFSGGARNIATHIFPVGTNASSTATKWGATVAIANNAAGFPTCLRHVIDEGQKIVLNSDAGGGANLWGFINVLLLDK